SQKNTRRPCTGSLPRARNISAPKTTVIASASSGEARLQNRDASGRGSSFSMLVLLPPPLGEGRGGGTPQPAHPLADQRHGRPRPRDRGRQAPLGDHVQAVADLEQ